MAIFGSFSGRNQSNYTSQYQQRQNMYNNPMHMAANAQRQIMNGTMTGWQSNQGRQNNAHSRQSGQVNAGFPGQANLGFQGQGNLGFQGQGNLGFQGQANMGFQGQGGMSANHPGNMPSQGQGHTPAADPMVRFEALTDEEKRVLGIRNDNAASPANPPNRSVPAKMPELPSNNAQSPNTDIFFNINETYLEKLRDAAQNAENGAIFYEKLAGAARTSSSRESLEGFAVTNRNLSAQIKEIYKTFTGEEPGLREARIADVYDLKQGVAFAVDEEMRNFSDLCDIYENMVDDRQLKRINALIYRKIGDLYKLRLIT